MPVEHLVALIEEILQQVQTMSGRPPATVGGGTVPIGDLQGFDSLNGLEVTILLAERIGYAIPGDVNLFVSEDGRRALTVRQIAERIQGLVPAERE